MSKVKEHRLSNHKGKLGLLALIVIFLVVLRLLSPAANAQTSGASNSSIPKVSKSNGVENKDYSLNPAGVATDKYPTVRIDFSVKRKDQTDFQGLTPRDIEANLNGDILTLKDSSLKQNDAPIRVLFMLDRSGSMKSAGKMAAAQDALKEFVRGLDTNDVASIYTFDASPTLVVSPTTNKSSLYAGIDSIQARSGGDTYLYNAVDSALQIADQSKNGIDKVIVLSDGWEDTPATKSMTDGEFASYKRQQEDAISRLSRQRGIRVYTVAIGARGRKEELGYSYVDYDSLCSISKGTGGGFCRLVNLPSLQLEANSNGSQLSSLISRDIKKMLAEIKKSFEYKYSLNVDFPRDLKHEDGKLTMSVTVDNGVKLPVIFPYTWDEKSGRPIFGEWNALPPIFIETATQAFDWLNLTEIYLLLLLPLGLMALVPTFQRRLMVLRELQQMKKAVVEVGHGSNIVGLQCPNETGEWGKRFAFKVGDPVVICPNPRCKTPHHLECWELNQHHCMIHACEQPMKIPSSVMERYGVAETTRGVGV